MGMGCVYNFTLILCAVEYYSSMAKMETHPENKHTPQTLHP